MIDHSIDLITPFVIGENGEQSNYTYTTEADFEQSQIELKQHISDRKSLISSFVD